MRQLAVAGVDGRNIILIVRKNVLEQVPGSPAVDVKGLFGA